MTKRAHFADFLFFVGVFFIPFDNIKIAPSSGWAAISPYFFGLAACFYGFLRPHLIYRLVSYVKVKYYLFLLFVCIVSCICYLLFDVYWNLVGLNIFKLFLGLSFLICLFCIQSTFLNWMRVAIRLLAISYSISVLFGILQLGTILGLFPPFSFFEIIFARYYPTRVQFTFTEPSFVSMHVIGIILYILLTTLHSKEFFRKVLMIDASLLILISLLSGSSLRIFVDCFLLALVFLFILPWRNKIKIFASIAIFIIPLLLSPPAVLVSRLEKLSNVSGISDPSSEIRKFRVESALYGVQQNLFSLLFGYGFGNGAVAMTAGFNEAYPNLNGTYGEVEALRSKQDGLTYSMHARLISEHGLFGYILLFLLIYNKKYKILFFSLLIIYLQFDSMAFYTVWLYVYARVFSIASDITVINLLRGKRLTRNRIEPQYN